MSHVNARFLLVGNDLLPQVQELVNEPFSIVPLDVIVSSSETRKVEDGLLGWDDVIPMNHDKSKNGYAEEIGRHFTYLHTSGSTGTAPYSLIYLTHSQKIVCRPSQTNRLDSRKHVYGMRLRRQGPKIEDWSCILYTNAFVPCMQSNTLYGWTELINLSSGSRIHCFIPNHPRCRWYFHLR